jgi:CHASE3 domain sensor protein
MPFTWTFGRKLALGFAVPAVVLLLVALLGYQSIERLIRNQQLEGQSYDVRLGLGAVLDALQDAETGARGYVISGHEEFLEPYKAAAPALTAAMEDLRRLTANDPSQLGRVEQLRSVADQKLEQMQSYVDLRRDKGFEVAVADVTRGEGRRLMEQARRIMGELDRDEVSRLRQRAKEADESAATAQSVIFWGSGLGLFFILAVAFFIARSLTNQVGSAEEL